MARQPERPWYWAAQDVWVVQWNGRRIRLARGKGSRKEATAAFHKMMAESARPPEPETDVPPVGLIVALYLKDLIRRREAGEIEPQTKADAERRLEGFVEACGDLPVDKLRPHHVNDWVASKRWVPPYRTRTITRRGKVGRPKETDPPPEILPPPRPPDPRPLGPTARHDCVATVKSVFRWAKREGHIEINPIDEMAKPRRKARREAIPSPDSAAKALASVITPELDDILRFIHVTGCRPKEARLIEATQLDLEAGVAILRKHKTSHKVEESRRIILPGPAKEIAVRLAAKNPEGPIFRNSRGRPWTKDALVNAVTRLRKRSGLGEELVAYGFRHLYATDALARGEGAAVVAELMGHKGLRMLQTYSHVSDRHEALRSAAERVRGSGSEPTTNP